MWRAVEKEVKWKHWSAPARAMVKISYLHPPTMLQDAGPSCQIHTFNPQISSCFSTTESTCLQQDSSLSSGKQPEQERKVKWAASCFSWVKKSSALNLALMALSCHSEPARALSLPRTLWHIYRNPAWLQSHSADLTNCFNQKVCF